MKRLAWKDSKMARGSLAVVAGMVVAGLLSEAMVGHEKWCAPFLFVYACLTAILGLTVASQLFRPKPSLLPHLSS